MSVKGSTKMVNPGCFEIIGDFPNPVIKNQRRLLREIQPSNWWSERWGWGRGVFQTEGRVCVKVPMRHSMGEMGELKRFSLLLLSEIGNKIPKRLYWLL